MSDPSFSRMATQTASIKRSALSAGLGGAPAPVLSSLACTPLDSVSAETRSRLQLDSAYELWQTSLGATYDIRKGDLLSLAGVDYPIRAVESYQWRATTYLRLIVEKTQ